VKIFIKFWVVVCFCLPFAGSLGQITKSGQGYLFRYQYVKGKTYRYAMESKVKNAGMNMNVGLKFKVTVLRVGPKTSKLRYEIDSMTQNGKPIGRSQTAEVEIDRRGNVVGDAATVQQLGNVAYPQEPIAVGKSWSRKVNSNAMGFRMNLTGNYKLTGFRKVGSKEYAVLAVSTQNAGDFTINGKGTMLVDRADGMVYDYSMTMTVGMKTGQQSVQVENVVTIKRQ